ncbi:class I SAM-dependent methyltransferase [Halanaerobium sp. ST460_2HS_T2]|uniref:class I SAM-dependent methyltransferase n=1 Tax=Halanaerobium sp. ST460_2HS_T2 TaxID=2183914 RepID=UPI000DF1AB76|nr:class I SAM-dependent methyltransferase [Halanaerobium sp. ST460_2HS_T2]RCW57484.1 methyltransferase family protein [Halanaerobium sp. ST460_2HS_T2]
MGNKNKIKKRYNRVAPVYDSLEYFMEKGKMGDWRENLWQMDIQNLRFEDNYFDLIVTSCVFCSVPDPIKGLKELKRVLKEDGRILMLEHMRSQNKMVGKLMDWFNWVSLYTWGANINRRTIENIKKAGLELVEVNNLMSDIVKEIELKKKIKLDKKNM